MKKRFPAIVAGAVLTLLPCAAWAAPRPTLYVHFIDQLSPLSDAPAINGLEERRRGPLFQEALQAASVAHELGPVVVTNPDIHLYSPKSDEANVPVGATLVRVYLTRWNTDGIGGFVADEVQCRIFAEVVRGGRTVAKIGPFFGRVPYSLTEATTNWGRYAVFRDAARQAIDQMAHTLPSAIGKPGSPGQS